MNAERLLQHYEGIADAPDAITRLRRFVLDLAVRGKLVPQDPNDEPASELLKRIAKEKSRLLKVGGIRSVKTSEPIRDEELPIELPRNWVWARLCDIGKLSGGMTPSMNRSDFWGGDIVWLSPKDIKSDEASDSELKISALGLTETRLELYRSGCLFMVARSGILKRTFPVAINRVPAAANQDIKVLAPFLDGHERYLQIMFRGLTDFLLRELVKTGTTVQSLRYAEFEQQPFPLPPLAEQHRIVAKVDELMILCDKLEAVREARETTRDRLAAASFARLNAPDPDTFQADACFALGALPALTTRPDQMKRLRQTILNLAVRGKLVPQDANDEPAAEFLKQIGNEKARLGKAGAQKAQQSPKAPSLPSELFDLPMGWSWATLLSVCHSISDGDHQPPPRSETGVPFLVIGDVRTKTINYDAERKVPHEYFNGLDPIRKPRAGDLLYTLVGSFGIPVPVLSDQPFCVQRHIGILRPSKKIERDALAVFLESDFAFKQAEAAATGIAQKTVSLAGLRSMLLPIPPLAEQRRIVAKVDALMAFCDQLEASLAAGADTRRRLLDALLAEALTPAQVRDLEAAE